MKRGFNSTGEFRTAYLGRWEFLWEVFEDELDAAWEISPCSAIRVQCNGMTFGGQMGPSYDPKVPPINLDMRQPRVL